MYVLTRLDKKRGLRIPEMSEQLAEIVGIHFGDGTMESGATPSGTWKLAYACDARRPKYTEYIKRIFLETTGIQLHVSEDRKRHCTVLYIQSKTLCEFFNKELEIPYGRKIDLKIPAYIWANEDYLTAFLRGMFDTDGCYITQKFGKYSYNQLRFTTKHKVFAEDIKRALEKLGMKSYICQKGCDGYDVTIRNVKSYQKFMELIKPQKEKVGVLRFELRSSAVT